MHQAGYHMKVCVCVCVNSDVSLLLQLKAKKKAQTHWKKTERERERQEGVNTILSLKANKNSFKGKERDGQKVTGNSKCLDLHSMTCIFCVYSSVLYKFQWIHCAFER